jgi:hypothetical protein
MGGKLEMEDDWYYRAAETEQGPFTRDRLEELARSGAFAPTDEIRRGTEGEWVRPSLGLFSMETVGQQAIIPEREITTLSEGPRGIGGWLLLPAFHLILSELIFLRRVIVLPEMPWIIVNACLAAFTLYCGFLFFGRRRTTKDTMISWYVVGVASDLAGRYAGTVYSTDLALFPRVFAAMVWILYFIKSRRVAATFTR